MKQSFIIISDVNEIELQNALMEFANQYSEEDFVKQIELFRKKGELQYLVLFNNEPNVDHFAFAVNFIRYIETKSRKKPEVTGYYRNHLKSSSQIFLKGEFVKIYVSENDDQFDNVNIVNNKNETFFYDFDGTQYKLSTSEKVFEVPNIDLENYNHFISIIPAPKEVKQWWKFW